MNDILYETKTFNEKDITPKDLLKFAKHILCVIVIIFILSCISELFVPGNEVFKICKEILPPFATLIVGFYFGKNK